LEEQLADRKVNIDLTVEARDWLSKRGYDPSFGARPLARVIQDKIKKPLAEELLFGKLANGGRVQVEMKQDKLAFTYPKADTAAGDTSDGAKPGGAKKVAKKPKKPGGEKKKAPEFVK
jgi:ATP-dependent Clp protease ATP-binding subunit ClpA